MSTIQSDTPFNLNTKITGDDLLKLKKEVGNFNVKLKLPREPEKAQMGQDQFLRLLTIQLSKQDPLNPMQNHEFIAQMAQFSSLEQMTKVNKSVSGLSDVMARMQSQNLLGKEITFTSGDSATPKIGNVSRIQFEEDGKTTLFVDKIPVKLSDVMGVTTPVEDRANKARSSYGFAEPKY